MAGGGLIDMAVFDDLAICPMRCIKCGLAIIGGVYLSGCGPYCSDCYRHRDGLNYSQWIETVRNADEIKCRENIP